MSKKKKNQRRQTYRSLRREQERLAGVGKVHAGPFPVEEPLSAPPPPPLPPPLAKFQVGDIVEIVDRHRVYCGFQMEIVDVANWFTAPTYEGWVVLNYKPKVYSTGYAPEDLRMVEPAPTRLTDEVLGELAGESGESGESGEGEGKGEGDA